MKKTLVFSVLLIATGLTSACEGGRTIFSDQKKAPDEFAVYSRAPLSLPPNFKLRPPQPGATRPQVVAPRNDARKALLKSSEQPPLSQAGDKKLTPGVVALLKKTGADQAKPNIRALVNQETFLLSGDGGNKFVDSILFWRKRQGYKGQVIDPGLEQRRLRLKKSQGDAVTDRTPTIQRGGDGQSIRKDSKSFWKNLF